MALKSIGKDPTDIGGYDIEKPLEDFDAVVSQGLNGAIYALIALNADDPDANKGSWNRNTWITYWRGKKQMADFPWMITPKTGMWI